MSASLHNRLLDIPILRESIVFNIREVVGAYPLATWCLSSFDVDRTVGQESSRSWSRVVGWKRFLENEEPVKSTIALDDDGLSDMLSNVLIQALADPSALCDTILPTAPQAPQVVSEKRVPTRGPHAPGKDDDTSRNSECEEESESDRNGRFRASSLGALRWLICEA